MRARGFVAVVIAFGAGYWLGVAGWLPQHDNAAPARTDTLDPASAPVNQVGPPRDRQATATTAWLVAEFERLLRAGRFDDAAPLRAALIVRVRDLAGAGAAIPAQALLDELVGVDPFEGEFLLLASELEQRQGRLEEAMEPLLLLLAQSDDRVLVDQAREELRLLVNVLEAQLAARRDQRGLVRLFERLAMRDPAHDGHRLSLARWLLQDGRVDAAARVAREIGTNGVTDAARDDLLAELELARAGLPFEQDVYGIHVRGRIADVPVRLLVDTGASTTVISTALARSLGTRPTRREVPVRTAGGTVTGELHRVAGVRIGVLELAELEVLVLDHVPAGSDGLLGMDVLGRVPAAVLPAALLGRPPASG